VLTSSESYQLEVTNEDFSEKILNWPLFLRILTSRFTRRYLNWKTTWSVWMAISPVWMSLCACKRMFWSKSGTLKRHNVCPIQGISGYSRQLIKPVHQEKEELLWGRERSGI